MHIANLEAHTTLNTCNLWKLALRGHVSTVANHKNDAVTARSQLHNIILLKVHSQSYGI